MTARRPWPLAVALIGVLLAVAVFVWSQSRTQATIEVVERPASDTSPAERLREERVEFATRDQTEAPNTATTEPAAESSIGVDSSIEQDPLPPIDVAALAREGLSDEAFAALVERLREDPALLAALIDEARSETDQQRLERLLRLLGSIDDPAVVALATELVYSGDASLQALGLDLMKRVRPGNPDVLANVSSILSTEINGEVLVPALTALARTGNTDDGTRASLAGQVALLVDHADASVRRTSLTILSRWSNDATYTPQLLDGLQDPEPTVQRAAAFAFVGHEDSSPAVRDSLMRMAANNSVEEAPRRGAILALQRMPLSDAEREQVRLIERQLDTRPSR